MEVTQVAFTRGEVSPLAFDRTDESFYSSSLQTCVNFFVRAEGGVSNRPGLQYVATCASATPNGSYLLPFIYNNVQSYLTEWAAGTTNVYSQGALIQSGIANVYASTDLPNLRWAQSADTLNLTVNTQALYQLKRTTPSNFTLTSPTVLNGPFQDLNTDGTTYVYASGTQGTVTITASKGIFKSTHVGALFTIQEQFLNSIAPWEAQKILVYPTASSPVGMYVRSDGKIYQCVSALTSTDHTSTGVFQPVHLSGTQQDGDGQPVPNFVDVAGVSWQFVSTNAGVAQITQFISATQVKAIVQSNKGIYSNFPPTVVGGPVTVVGPFTFNGTGSQTSFSGLTAITSTDPNQFFVTVGGIFQDPTTFKISGTTIIFNSAPAAGTNNVVVSQVTGTLTNIYGTTSSATPTAMTGLCLSTYWAFGSLSAVQGYGATCCYFNDRFVMGGTQLQPQTAFTSKVSNYLDFGVSTPQIDSDGITFTINARRENPIVDLIPLNDLLIGTASSILRLTHSPSVGAVTPSDISILPQNFYGQQAVPSVQTGDTVIYVQWGGRKIRDLAYQFQYDKYVGQEITVYARQVFPIGTSCVRMAFAPEPFGLLFCVRSDGVMCVCTYLPEQRVTAWTRFTTQGFFEDVCVLPENGSFTVYVIVRRVINGNTVRYIEKFAPREFATVNDAFFVDSGLTYDGRNTSTTTMILTGGTTWQAQDVGILNASSTSGWAGFQASDVGNGNNIWLYDSAGNQVNLQITLVSSATQATVRLLTPAPTTLRGKSTLVWTFAKTNFTGLSNIVGQTVNIFADGAILPQQAVTQSGSVTLPVPGGVVHVGLPYTCQIQSMQMTVQGQETIRNRNKRLEKLAIVVDQSGPFFVGSDFVTLDPVPQREFESYGNPVALKNGILYVQCPSNWQDDLTVCLQHTDPVPLSVLGWVATIELGEPG